MADHVNKALALFKERQAMRADGRIKVFIVKARVDFSTRGEVDLRVEAANEEEARRLVNDDDDTLYRMEEAAIEQCTGGNWDRLDILSVSEVGKPTAAPSQAGGER